MGLIYFNGQSSADYGFEVSQPPVHNFPKRIYEKVIVPGKNGEVVYDTGCYSNVPREYNINFISDSSYEESARKVVDFLHSPGGGYFRLEDTYEPDYYRMACFEDDGSISNIFEQGGTTTIRFNCKPECWLKSGETPIIIPYTSTVRETWDDGARHACTYKYTAAIYNDTCYQSSPLFILDFSDQSVLDMVSLFDEIVIDRDKNQLFTMPERRVAIINGLDSAPELNLVDAQIVNIDYYSKNAWSSFPTTLNLNRYVNRDERDTFSTTEFFGLDPKTTAYIFAYVRIVDEHFIDEANFDPSKIKVSITPRWWVL